MGTETYNYIKHIQLFVPDNPGGIFIKSVCFLQN